MELFIHQAIILNMLILPHTTIISLTNFCGELPDYVNYPQIYVCGCINEILSLEKCRLLGMLIIFVNNMKYSYKFHSPYFGRKILMFSLAKSCRIGHLEVVYD